MNKGVKVGINLMGCGCGLMIMAVPIAIAVVFFLAQSGVMDQFLEQVPNVDP